MPNSGTPQTVCAHGFINLLKIMFTLMSAFFSFISILPFLFIYSPIWLSLLMLNSG